MKYTVTVKPGSSQEKIVESSENSGTRENGKTDGSLTVYLHARPHGGEANAALVQLLAKYFKVPKTSIKILRGEKAHTKVIEF